MLIESEAKKFRLTPRNDHGTYAAIYRDGKVTRFARLPGGAVVEPLPEEYADQVDWRLPARLTLKKSGAVLRRLGLVLLGTGEPAAVFNCGANVVRTPAPGRPENSVHDGTPSADYVQIYNHHYAGAVPGSARVRVYSRPDRQAVVLITDHRRADRECPEEVLALAIVDSQGISNIHDAVWIEHEDGCLAWKGHG